MFARPHPIENRPEHRFLRLAPVVSEGVLVQVALEVVAADRVVDAAHAILEQAEEPLDGLGMGVADGVDLRFMLDPAVPAILAAQRFVGVPFIGEEHR